jgi:hypothetical protein
MAAQTGLTGHGQEPTAFGENGIPRQFGTAAFVTASLDWLSLHGRRLPFPSHCVWRSSVEIVRLQKRRQEVLLPFHRHRPSSNQL